MGLTLTHPKQILRHQRLILKRLKQKPRRLKLMSKRPKQKLRHPRWTFKHPKQFDACEAGQKPFKFKLGSGQVIKGWDLGILGMKVGGKRRLTVPAPMAYGRDGSPPDIPANSTLVFDVECKLVK